MALGEKRYPSKRHGLYVVNQMAVNKIISVHMALPGTHRYIDS